ncbi:hypothetical protein Hanom_Chr01g00005431 [Helianthus anomalus]
MGIFSGDRGNLLEEIYDASAPTGVKSSKGPRKFDISQITSHASLPSRTIDLSPSRDGLGKKKEDDVNVEHAGEGGGDVAGGDGGVDKGKGVETEMESSETTPHQTIYTKRPPGGGGGATSGMVHSPHFEDVRAGSWETRNPACDDLPHAPRWRLTQGSRMNDLDNCHDFFSLCLPLLRWCSRKGVIDRPREETDGEVTVEFEYEKRDFVEEKEKINAEKNGLMWRVSDAEQKLAQEKQVNAKKQKDWEVACERSNAEMQSQRDAIIRLSGEKEEIAEEAQQARAAFEKKEKEYVDRIAVEHLLEEKVAECKASKLLVEEVSADCSWLLSRAVPLIANRIVNSRELANYMFELGQAGYNSGRKDGYGEGRAAADNNEKDYHFELYKEDCTGKYAAKRQDFASLEFAVVKAAQKLSRKADSVALLKKALGDDGRAAGGAGTSRPE